MRILEFKRSKYLRRDGDVSYYQILQIEIKLDLLLNMAHTFFEMFTGYFIHKEILSDAFKNGTLFKRIKKPQKPLYLQDFDSEKYTFLRFTFSAVNSCGTNKNNYPKKNIILWINNLIEDDFWTIAILSIYYMQLEKPNIKIDTAIKIFYKYIKLSLTEYDINSFKRTLYKHKFHLLKKKFRDKSHFIAYTKALFIGIVNKSNL